MNMILKLRLGGKSPGRFTESPHIGATVQISIAGNVWMGSYNVIGDPHINLIVEIDGEVSKWHKCRNRLFRDVHMGRSDSTIVEEPNPESQEKDKEQVVTSPISEQWICGSESVSSRSSPMNHDTLMYYNVDIFEPERAPADPVFSPTPFLSIRANLIVLFLSRYLTPTTASLEYILPLYCLRSPYFPTPKCFARKSDF